MKFNSKLTMTAIAVVAIGVIFYFTQTKEDAEVAVDGELVFPSLSYRTGPYAPNGIPFADGYADYFTLLNERDGGIGGVPIKSSNARPVTTPKKAWSVMSPPRAKARWSINPCPPASPTS